MALDVNTGIAQAITVEELNIQLTKAQQAGIQLVTTDNSPEALDRYRQLLINENSQEYSSSRDLSANAKVIADGLYQRD